MIDLVEYKKGDRSDKLFSHYRKYCNSVILLKQLDDISYDNTLKDCDVIEFFKKVEDYIPHITESPTFIFENKSYLTISMRFNSLYECSEYILNSLKYFIFYSIDSQFINGKTYIYLRSVGIDDDKLMLKVRRDEKINEILNGK